MIYEKKSLECNKEIVNGVLLFLSSITLLPFILLYIILYEFYIVYSYFQGNNIYQGSLTTDDKNNIWKYCEGIEEQELIQYGKYLFICQKCNYPSDTFKDFIPNISSNDNDRNNDTNDTMANININPGLNINNEMSIMLFSSDQSFHYSVICKLTDTFESIENKLYQDSPHLKNKNLLFLSKGTAINDKKKTLAQLKLKNSDIIISYETNK